MHDILTREPQGANRRLAMSGVLTQHWTPNFSTSCFRHLVEHILWFRTPTTVAEHYWNKNQLRQTNQKLRLSRLPRPLAHSRLDGITFYTYFYCRWPYLGFYYSAVHCGLSANPARILAELDLDLHFSFQASGFYHFGSGLRYSEMHCYTHSAGLIIKVKWIKSESMSPVHLDCLLWVLMRARSFYRELI
jgi:hypothetical protein